MSQSNPFISLGRKQTKLLHIEWVQEDELILPHIQSLSLDQLLDLLRRIERARDHVLPQKVRPYEISKAVYLSKLAMAEKDIRELLRDFLAIS